MSERKDYRIHNLAAEFREPKPIAPLPDTSIQPFDITDAEISAAAKVLNSSDPVFDMGNTPHWALKEGKNPFQKAEDKLKDKDDDGDSDDKDSDDSDDKDDDGDDNKDDDKKKKAKVVVKVEEGRDKKLTDPKSGDKPWKRLSAWNDKQMKDREEYKKAMKEGAPAEKMHKEPKKADLTGKKASGKAPAEKMHKEPESPTNKKTSGNPKAEKMHKLLKSWKK